MEAHEHQCSMNESTFFRKAYHNLRNPIVVIKGYAALMLDGCGGDLTGEQREWLSDMKSNSDYLLSLINNLAELSFIEAGIAENKRTEVNLSKILNETLEEFSEHMRKKALIFRKHMPEHPISLNTDGTMIAKAFKHLIHNAILYSGEDETVDVTLKEEAGEVHFSVSDNGPGIRDADKNAIMEGFFKGQEEEGHKGTGLGILIARRISEIYGGSLSLESAPGNGSTFTMTLKG